MAKIEKICIVCGKTFKGTAKAKVCTDNSNCRVKLKRLLDKGLQPAFRFIIPKRETVNNAESKNKALSNLPKGKTPKNLNELKELCPPELTGLDRSTWIANERQKYGV